jgi:hypothetical protein
LLLIYGLLNALLYISLVPLWEGFDEEFHYSYVQYLAAHHSFPVKGRTGLSEEVNASLGLAPISHVMVNNMRLQDVPEIRSFAQYFALSSAQRHALREAVRQIPRGLRLRESARYSENYEAQHAPLSYLLLSIPNYFLRNAPLPQRIWILRLLVTMACVLLVFRGVWALGAEAGLNETFTAAVAFLTFSCQMFWATIAHVGNDWLAVLLAVWLMVWGLRCHRQPAVRNAVWLGVVLSAGLLTKAYFLVFVPLYLLAAVVWYRKRMLPVRGLAALVGTPLVLAGPWHVRNLMLYGSLSGRLAQASGATLAGTFHSLLEIPWMKSLPFMLRGAFWLGNMSFNDFSVGTMNTLLALLAVALVLYAIRGRKPLDVFLWAPAALFCAAMIFDMGSLYTYTNGAEKVTGPWYLQAIMIPVLSLAMLGCRRSGRTGRWIAAVSVVLWGYIMAATYAAKLFPMYGGFAGGRSTLRDLAYWYGSDWPRIADILNTTAMAPASVLAALLGMVLAAMLLTMASLLRSMVRSR